uniref:Uncharacterized protein n=1 Tax=Anguilla anguilla TaxID=7936 RepID=A0A0E9P5S9_ANGAN
MHHCYSLPGKRLAMRTWKETQRGCTNRV